MSLFCGFGKRDSEDAGPVKASKSEGSNAPLVRKCKRVVERTALLSEDQMQACRSVRAEKSSAAAKQNDKAYKMIVNEAEKCVGCGIKAGSFPEEWDAQLFIDCGLTAANRRLVLFVPDFLQPIIEDGDELDRAFRFIVLKMDKIAMDQKFVFVYCCFGMNWSHPNLAERLNLAFDILPSKYTKNLQKCYILHANSSVRLTMWAFWAWLSNTFWEKVEYVDSIDFICKELFPNDDAAQADLRRRFPQIIQRQDAEAQREEPPVNFGVDLRDICNNCGVDFVDRTTGRYYPRLPPTLIVLCEALERCDASADFQRIFDVDGTVIFDLLDRVDKGMPLPVDLDPALLWCCLKVWLDCLPSPLLSSEATDFATDFFRDPAMQTKSIEKQRGILVKLFTEKLPKDTAYVALYLSSCLQVLCEMAQDRGIVALTPASAAKVFAPSFLRPQVYDPVNFVKVLPVAESLIKTLIEAVNEPELWIGGQAPNWSTAAVADDSDSEDEGQGESV